LQVSREAAKGKLANLDRNRERMRTNQRCGATDLGMPVLTPR
jgi:hypothetical protein